MSKFSTEKSFKWHSLMIILLVVFMALFILVLNLDKRNNDVKYNEIFYTNQEAFAQVANSLITYEKDTIIYRRNDGIGFEQNEDIFSISEAPISVNTKNNIRKILSSLSIFRIEKTKNHVEFIFDNGGIDHYSIVYSTRIEEMNYFTDTYELEQNWYYCYIFHE